MKINSLTTAFLLATALLIAGCRLGCLTTKCENGHCEDGDCHCNPGWLLDGNGKCTVPDPCFAKICFNGTCNGGNCECDPGYSTDAQGLCRIQNRQAFLGTWRGTHTISGGAASAAYNIAITPANWDSTKVQISGFFNLSCPSIGGPVIVNAYVATTSLAYDFQVICSQPTLFYDYAEGNTIELIDPNTIRINSVLQNVPSGFDGAYLGTYQKL